MDVFTNYTARSDVERHDLARIRLLAAEADPYARSLPLHLTGSALVVHPPTGRVMLRWHERQRAWIQVGGHGDPGEVDPLDVAIREAREETGLDDVAPLPGADGPIHVVCVPVGAKGDEPAHEHADIRYVLATDAPDDAVPENDDAPLRWLTFDEALDLCGEDNVRETLIRARDLMGTTQKG